MHRRTPWWCYAVLFAAVCSVSSAGVVFKWIDDVPPMTLAAWRLQLTTVITAVAAIVQWQKLSEEHRVMFRKDLWWSVLSGVTLAVHFGAWVWSLQHTSLAHSLLLVSTTPIILVAVALVLRHAISTGEVLGALLALAGCALLTGGAVSGKEVQVSLAGDLAAFGAAVAIVGHWQVGKHLRTYQPVFVYSAPVTALAAGLLTVTGLVTEEGTLIGPNNHGVIGWVTSKRYAPFVVYLGAVPGVVGHQGFNTVLKYMTPLMVSLAVQFEPVIGPALGWAVGVAAAPGVYTWCGGAMLLLATAGATVATAKREQKEEHLVKSKSMRLPTHDDDFDDNTDGWDDAAGANAVVSPLAGGGGYAQFSAHDEDLQGSQKHSLQFNSSGGRVVAGAAGSERDQLLPRDAGHLPSDASGVHADSGASGRQGCTDWHEIEIEMHRVGAKQ